MKSKIFSVLIFAALAAAAHEHPKGHAEHAASGTGTISFDLCSADGILHLLSAKSAGQNGVLICHQTSNDGGATWSREVQIDANLPTPHHPHRGNDIQFAAHKNNLIAVWSTKGTGWGGGGPMVTALSSDGGTTWTKGGNPADDNATTSHGYVDIVADKSGTFHAVWLDSRAGSQGLYYSNSKDGGATWSKNSPLDPACCECCWNRISVSEVGEIAVLFRQRKPRDMAVRVSKDNGASWSQPQVVGEFKWDFPGCPHVGGGLSIGDNQLFATVWSGSDNHNGLFGFSSKDSGVTWLKSALPAGPKARNSDVAHGPTGKLGAVWDEPGAVSKVFFSESADAGASWSVPRQLSPADKAADHPRVVWTGKAFRCYWTEIVDRDETALNSVSP